MLWASIISARRILFPAAPLTVLSEATLKHNFPSETVISEILTSIDFCKLYSVSPRDFDFMTGVRISDSETKITGFFSG